MIDSIVKNLGEKAEYYLGFKSPKIPKEKIHVPSGDWVDRLFGTGRLAGTGYLSILPVDQGIEHAAGASFAKNPEYFDPENIVKLAIEGGCNAVASTYGCLLYTSDAADER